MNEKDLSTLKAEIARDLMKQYIAKVIDDQEKVMLYTKLKGDVEKKKESERTEEEKTLIGKNGRYQAIIDEFTRRLEHADLSIQNYLTLIKSYEENKPLKL